MEKPTIRQTIGKNNGIGDLFFAKIDATEAVYQLRIYAGNLQGVGPYLEDFKRSHPGCSVLCLE